MDRAGPRIDLPIFGAALALLVVLTWHMHHRPRPVYEFVLATPHIAETATPARSDIAASILGVAHAPSAAELPDGRILAVWFEGIYEGHDDVRLRSATLKDGVWTPSHDLMDARRASRDLRRHVRTVGNPVMFRHPSGEYWLVFVSVTFGGWSGSSLNLMRSPDGLAWGPVQRLSTGPVNGLSTLAKAPPIALTDGTIALPVYHEMLGKFPELLFISPQGRVIDKVRMGTGGRSHLQPWLVATGRHEAFALLRGAGRAAGVLWRTETRDGGRTWSRPKPVDLPNPTSPVALIALGAEEIGLVFNDDRRARTLTRLAVSRDKGLTWRRAGIVEDGRASGIFHRYHWLLVDGAGRLHLLNSAYREGGRRRAIHHRILSREAFNEPEDRHVR